MLNACSHSAVFSHWLHKLLGAVQNPEGKAGSVEKGCPASQGSQGIQGGCRKFSGSPKALHSYNSPLI